MLSLSYRQVLHIDLSEGVPALDHIETAQGVYVVLWWRDIPLTHQQFKAEQLPISATQLADIILADITSVITKYCTQKGVNLSTEICFNSLRDARNSELNSSVATLTGLLNQFDKLIDHTCTLENQNKLPVSIVIPTRNRPQMLARCLASLQQLRLKPLEIIVVDNDPASGSTPQILDQFAGVRYIAQPQPGASVARNTGVQHSQGNIVAFADDDEVLHPDWLTWLWHGFNDPKIGVVTGLVLPEIIETQAQYFFENRFSFVRGYQSQTFDTSFFEQKKLHGVPVWHIGGSGNMAIRRDLFEQIGGFDELLGGGQAGCSEDTELFYRVLATGWHIQYQPRAVCYHYHRSDQTSLKKQIFSYMRGHVTALLVQYVKYRDISNLHRLFLVLPLVYTKYALRSLRQDPAFPWWVLKLEILGCISGIKFYWQNRRYWQTSKSLSPG